MEDLSSNPEYHPLSQLMSDISERCYCANWMMGTEFVLFDAVIKKQPVVWGQDKITKKDINKLKRLSEKYGCWPYWYDPIGVILISLNDFCKLYNHRK
jgi:hypothetical protein